MIPRYLLLFLLLLSLCPPAVMADRHGRHRDQHREEGWERTIRQREYDRGGGREISLNEAVQMVQRRYNARVVRAESSRDGDRTVYRLRLLSEDGRVWTVTVDASSGAIR